MKKIILMMAAGAMLLASCGNGTPSASLDNKVDTLSYYLGMAQTQGLKEYMVNQLKVDTAYVDDFIRGINEGASDCSKAREAYLAGIQIGQQVKNMMWRQINISLAGKDSVDIVNKNTFLNAFCTALKDPKSTKFELDSIMDKIEPLMKAVGEDAKLLDPDNKKNKEAGEKFLADNAKKDGVKTLPSGVQYKVIKAGTGAMPTDTSVVKCNYEGKLIDGKEFDSSYKRNEPFEVNLRYPSVIPGWLEVLKQMPAGSIWEVYIPQDQAYGSQEKGDIKPFSTLIFKIEIVEVK